MGNQDPKEVVAKRKATPLRDASNGAEAVPENTSDAAVASLFKADLTNIKSLVTCSICDQLLYEPWTLGCGHTYCYSCLCNWFVPNKRKKTCPECRTAVKHMPAPAYLVKEMAEIFTKRSELMPADESAEQHKTKRAEEMAEVEKDRNSAEGLFKGLFPPESRELKYDEADGVWRCPSCLSEHTGGPTCQDCQSPVEMPYDHEAYDIDDDFDEHDSLDGMDVLDMEADLDAMAMPHFPHHHVHHRPFHYRPFAHGHHGAGHYHIHDDASESDPDDSDLGEMSDSEDEGSLRDFVANDEEDVQEATINISSDDESEDDIVVRSRNPRSRPVRIDLSSSSDLDDDDVAPANRRVHRFPRVLEESPEVSVVDLTSSELDEAEIDEEAMARAGWSPLHRGVSSEVDLEDDFDGFPPSYDPSGNGEDSDTDTMVGGNGGSSDEMRARSESPRYEYEHYGSQPSEDENSGDEEQHGQIELKEDTDISTSRGYRSISIDPQAYEGDSDDEESNNGQQLGNANNVVQLEDDSSDDSDVRPAVRRRIMYSRPATIFNHQQQLRNYTNPPMQHRQPPPYYPSRYEIGQPAPPDPTIIRAQLDRARYAALFASPQAQLNPATRRSRRG